MRKSILLLVAMAALGADKFLPPSALTVVLRYLAMGYISIDLLLTARAGYLRRRPHWSPDSWRRFLAACAIPVAALLIFVLMMIVFELRLPIVGAPASSTRRIWVGSMVVFMLIGAAGLGIAVNWLAQGEPSRQFSWPRLRYRP
jgi:hypothetical protein